MITVFEKHGIPRPRAAKCFKEEQQEALSEPK